MDNSPSGLGTSPPCGLAFCWARSGEIPFKAYMRIVSNAETVEGHSGFPREAQVLLPTPPNSIVKKKYTLILHQRRQKHAADGLCESFAKKRKK